MELLSLLECLFSLYDNFAFFFFIICILAASEGLRQDEGLFLLVLPAQPLNQ